MDKNSFFNILFDKERIIPVFTIIFTVVYGYAAAFLLKRNRERRLKRKNTFIETFIRGIKDNTIENSEDLLNVYAGITNLSTEDLSNKQYLNSRHCRPY
jgi:hypothetical protein